MSVHLSDSRWSRAPAGIFRLGGNGRLDADTSAEVKGSPRPRGTATKRHGNRKWPTKGNFFQPFRPKLPSGGRRGPKIAKSGAVSGRAGPAPPHATRRRGHLIRQEVKPQKSRKRRR